jgi:phosphatidylinositol-3-phosphatase
LKIGKFILLPKGGFYSMNNDRRNVHFVTRIAIAVVAALALMVPLAASAQVTTRDASNSSIDNFQHVFVIMMENTSFTSLIGNSNAPFINSTAKKFGFAKNYFGVAHPSQPNYIAATSGSTNGVIDDSDVTVNATNIVDQIEGSGRTWKGYMQSLSLCKNSDPTQHACGNQLYERKHDPFISYQDVQNNPARVANIVDFSQFSSDLANNTVPNYSWISPDQCNDMHGRAATPSDPCDFSQVQKLIKTGDTFLKSTVNQILNSQAWQNSNSAIFITWDESDFPFSDTSGCCDANPGGGHVVTLVLLSENETARTSSVAYNHYSMLLTVESAWNLGCLLNTCDTTNVKPMTDLVNQNG